MPAFAIISGYFSKSGSPTKTQMARVITDILVPYVIFEFLWTLTKWFVEGQADPNFTKPSWTLWFLLALGIFRLVLPYLALLRWPLLTLRTAALIRWQGIRLWLRKVPVQPRPANATADERGR
jgi:fucose 4-O-acetylase-like acetyltransferase